jgi:SAM-dependent methyltransferase
MILSIDSVRSIAATLIAASLVLPAAAAAQQPPAKPPATQQTFEPTVGQAGKDVVWVPTPAELVDKMLDMAAVTPRDVVMDLGSGDGRNIIAAAKRGARAIGVEFNPDMVALSQRLAREAGVSDRASFVQGDMFEADISQATVMALFLLPDNLTKLRDKFLRLQPGTRIVLNTFGIADWEPDVTEKIGGTCASWCTAMLYIVPAQVQGTWKMAGGDLVLNQQFQVVTGTLTVDGKPVSIDGGKLRGDQISFTVAGAEYSGKVAGDRIEGIAVRAGARQNWAASRASR